MLSKNDNLVDDRVISLFRTQAKITKIWKDNRSIGEFNF